MPVGSIHTSGPIVVSGSSAFNLDGITEQQANPGLVEILENAGGVVDPSYVAVMQSMPAASATITDIATALTNIGISGLGFPQTTVFTTVDLYFTKAAERGTRATGGSHLRVRMNEGLIVPKQISWQQGQKATMQLEIQCTYDGTNAPFTYTTSASLPHTPSIDELFTGGDVVINGTELDGVQGVTFDFGLEVEKIDAGGEVYPTYVWIQARKPRFTIRTKEIGAINTFGLTGTAQGATDSVIYLQKISENGTRVAAATTEHISFTIDDGLIWCNPAGGANNNSHEVEVVIQPTYDGSNAIVVVNTAVAHPA